MFSVVNHPKSKGKMVCVCQINKQGTFQYFLKYNYEAKILEKFQRK